jgi:uncharacterized membrane protein
VKPKNFLHLDLWIEIITEKHDSGSLKAITKETWKQFGKMVSRAKESNLKKINVNSGLWNDLIVEFVKKEAAIAKAKSDAEKA